MNKIATLVVPLNFQCLMIQTNQAVEYQKTESGKFKIRSEHRNMRSWNSREATGCRKSDH